LRLSSNLKKSLLIIGLAACQQIAIPAHVEARAPVTTENNNVAKKDSGLPSTLAPMLAKVLPAVVSVSAEGPMASPKSEVFKDPALRRLLGLPELPTGEQQSSEQRFQSLGSGVVIDARQGYVVTVNHVVERAEKIHITLADKRQLDAKVIGADAQTDIAVLKVDPDRLVSLPLGESKRLQVGDYVVALGNPFGIGQTATFGIISGLGRMGFGIESYEDFIQTDASINPGNSGGALVDTTGRLIGISAALVSKDGGNVGIGFAIPVDVVNLVAQQLIATGKVSRGALGLVVRDLTPAATKGTQIQTASGAEVSQVNPDSAAAKAGIEDGDVVLELDGKTIATGGEFRNAIGLKQPGEMVKLKILHRGNERNVMAMLEPPM
jgi:serine protease DegQ